MALIRDETTLRSRISATAPAIETVEDALYVPGPADGWGLYDQGDRLVISGARWVPGASGAPLPASGFWSAPVREALDRTDETLVYGGLLETGTVSFLVGVLSRFWSHATRPGAARVLFHTREDLGTLFDQPVIASSLAALGIGPTDCLTFDTPTRIARVIVPAASFEAGRLIHSVYAQLAATLAIRLTGRVVPADLGRAPVHVSCARETVPAFAGEKEFDQSLEAAGVRVVHPSEMSLAALVAQVRSAGLLSSTQPAGLTGLGCHAAAFRNPAKRILLCLGERSQDSCNIDALCGHETLVLRPSDPGVVDPVEWSVAYQQAMRRLITTRRLACELSPDASLPELVPVACSTSDDNDGAILSGGPLTGLVQQRIAGAAYPWWQADLGAARDIDEVRIHGPITGDERPTKLRLFGSLDGRDWAQFAERNSDDPIGGIDGRFHRFTTDTPWRVRMVRVQSGTGVLSLDQVQILARTRSDALLNELAE